MATRETLHAGPAAAKMAAALVRACVCACVAAAGVTAAGVTAGDGGVPRARCTARCLGLRVPPWTPGQNHGALAWCRSHGPCAQCLQPCVEPRDASRGAHECHGFCEAFFPYQGSECLTSCEFLASVHRVKQGVCPAPAQAHGFAAACVESCEADRECAGVKKCCANGCGHTCQAPRAPYRGTPLKPRKELTFTEPTPGLLEVTWLLRFNVSMEPVVYVLQRRSNPGPHPSEDHATGWEAVAQTTEQHAQVPDLRPGRWYQFRVAAVNAHGTRGFTAPSKHIRSARAPTAPAAPTSLRVGNWTSDGEGHVRATVTWDGPEGDTDIPVQCFRVRWWSPGSGPRGTTRRATTEARSLALGGLTPGHTYTLWLRAEATWGGTRLRGETATLRFTVGSMSDAGPRPPGA